MLLVFVIIQPPNVEAEINYIDKWYCPHLMWISKIYSNVCFKLFSSWFLLWLSVSLSIWYLFPDLSFYLETNQDFRSNYNSGQKRRVFRTSKLKPRPSSREYFETCGWQRIMLLGTSFLQKTNTFLLPVMPGKILCRRSWTSSWEFFTNII